jgi:hypothetical protein
VGEIFAHEHIFQDNQYSRQPIVPLSPSSGLLAYAVQINSDNGPWSIINPQAGGNIPAYTPEDSLLWESQNTAIPNPTNSYIPYTHQTVNEYARAQHSNPLPWGLMPNALPPSPIPRIQAVEHHRTRHSNSVSFGFQPYPPTPFLIPSSRLVADVKSEKSSSWESLGVKDGKLDYIENEHPNKRTKATPRERKLTTDGRKDAKAIRNGNGSCMFCGTRKVKVLPLSNR